MTGEKTEKATPKRRKEARKEGQVARTQELGGWASMLLVSLVLPVGVKHEVSALRELFMQAMRSIEHPTIQAAYDVLLAGAGHALVSIVGLGCVVMVIGVAATLAQGGFYVASKSVKPSLKKLNLISGAKRLFGPQILWEGAKMVLKCALVAIFVWTSVRAMVPLMGDLLPTDVVLGAVGDQAMSMVRAIAVAALVMAGADYAMARRRTNKQTKMSKDDVRQEHKQAEGDPMLKGAIRARQLAAARNRMMSDIAHADVVLVNPTHVAVALRYEDGGAPRVVARGAGVVAARIRELAVEHDVTMVRDVPLARALYTSTQVGQEIPPELFAAVAQVLAFVISRRSRGVRGGTHRSPRAEVELGPVPVAGRRRRNVSGPALTGR